jgi:hypothetical protein
MRINYSFVEFHSPVFSQGKNHGCKIKANHEISLYFDSSIPNAKMVMSYKGKLTCFDTYHSADVIEEEKKVFIANVPEGTKVITMDEPKAPHHFSKEGRAIRAAQSGQGE